MASHPGRRAGGNATRDRERVADEDVVRAARLAKADST
jgi:hypothetical protein